MILGVLGGLFAPKIADENFQKLSHTMDMVAAWLLGGISLIIPLFLFGFLLKMQHNRLIIMLVWQYTKNVMVIIAALTLDRSVFFRLADGMRMKQILACIRNMIPPRICAFDSMSSASALPYTIAAVAKNATNTPLAKFVVSLTTNGHFLGDCRAIPIFICAILKSHGFPQPSEALYPLFTLQFVIAKFSVVAFPGGGMIVMVPIIDRCFGFNAAISSPIFSR
jgi:Na+/H+-dicarboxylate symporter